MFNINVANISADPVGIAIFVNPSKTDQSNRIKYYQLFPTSWKVIPFPGTPNAKPITAPVAFSTTLFKAYVAGSDNHNTITPSVSLEITSSQNRFELETLSNGAVELSPVGKIAGVDVSIHNESRMIHTVGVADGDGNPYFVIPIRDGECAAFNCQFEIAVAVVNVALAPGQAFKVSGSYVTYFTFLASDVIDSVDVTWNGSNLIFEGIDAESHDSGDYNAGFPDQGTCSCFIVLRSADT